jgi:hypothetical protein
MSAIDDAIREAMARGDFDNLPGAGKPLPLDDDPYTPDEMKQAYRIMKQNDLTPDWIAQGKALEKEADRLKRRAGRGVDARLRADVARYNRELLSFNLKLPPGIAHRPLLDADRLAEGG